MAGGEWRALAELAQEPLPEDAPPAAAVCLEALADPIALLRLHRGVPKCVQDAAAAGEFCAVVVDPDAAVAWVPRRQMPKAAKLVERDSAEEIDPNVSWCALRIGRPGKGPSLKLPAPPGAAGPLCSALLEAGAAVQLATAFGGEVLLVPEDVLPVAAATLVGRGHAIWPSTRVCDQEAWEPEPKGAPSQPEARRLAGAWGLVRREEPTGTVVADHVKGDGPIRLQAAGGAFVELRIAGAAPGAKLDPAEASCAGFCRWVEEDERLVCRHLRTVDYQPPGAFPPQWQVTLSSSSADFLSHPHGECRERWSRLSSSRDQAAVVLELQSETPEPPQGPRCGVWIFTGGRWARALGLERGGGVVGGTCCRSLGQLQRLRGSSDTRGELRANYEAAHGVLERPGLLRTTMAVEAQQAGTIFFDAASRATGSVQVDQSTVVRTLPNGKVETWRVIEWSFDPFAQGAPSKTKRRREPEPPVQAISESASEYESASEEPPPGPPPKRGRGALRAAAAPAEAPPSKRRGAGLLASALGGLRTAAREEPRASGRRRRG